MEMTTCPRCGQPIEDEIKEIDGYKMCRQCWKEYKEDRGLVDKGCIFDDMGGCLERDPCFIPPIEVTPEHAYDYGFSHPARLAVLANAKCYLGHETCRKQQEEMRKMIEQTKQAYENRVTVCPHNGCAKDLDISRDEEHGVLRAVCPVHGEIWHEHIH